jgi:deoxycytidine triphosphate deaminase
MSLPDDTSSVSFLELEPDEELVVATSEIFDIPKDMVGHVTVMSGVYKKGIVPLLSLFIDPGFQGRFFFPIRNRTKMIVRIEADEHILSIEFMRLPSAVDQGYAERFGVREKF